MTFWLPAASGIAVFQVAAAMPALQAMPMVKAVRSPWLAPAFAAALLVIVVGGGGGYLYLQKGVSDLASPSAMATEPMVADSFSIAAVPGNAVDADPARSPAPAAVPQPVARRPQPRPQVEPAYISVGTRPSATVVINGREATSNPVNDFGVAPGLVVISFLVEDSSGFWTVDTTVTVAPGERLDLGEIRLVRHN